MTGTSNKAAAVASNSSETAVWCGCFAHAAIHWNLRPEMNRAQGPQLA